MEIIIFILTCAVVISLWQNYKLRKRYNNFADDVVREVEQMKKAVAIETDKVILNRLDDLTDMYNFHWQHLVALANYFKIMSYRDASGIYYKKIIPLKPAKTNRKKK